MPGTETFTATAETSVDTEKRTMVATITTRDVDRSNTVIEPSGIALVDYRKNPIVVWGHQYFLPPIGVNRWIKPEGNTLIALTEFAKKPASYGSNPWLADTLLDLYAQKVLRGTSVGLIVKQSHEPTKEDIEKDATLTGVWRWITDSSLIEYSLVTVPKNQNALAAAIDKGDVDPANPVLEFIFPETKHVAVAATTTETSKSTIVERSYEEVEEKSTDHSCSLPLSCDIVPDSYSISRGEYHLKTYLEVWGRDAEGKEHHVKNIYPGNTWNENQSRRHARASEATAFKGATVVLQPTPTANDCSSVLKALGTPEELVQALLKGIDVDAAVKTAVDMARGRV